MTVPTSGLVYDWMTNNIYFIDSAEQNIKVLRRFRLKPKPIIDAVENSSITAIAIHLRQRYTSIYC